MSLRTDVSVLYVDPRGPYPKLVADWWDEKRDARLYAGPNPVVAHPPCGPYSKQRHNYRGTEHDCAPHALQSVRTFGGIFEHPAESRFWHQAMLATPDADGVSLGDIFGGYTIAVEQVEWGHVARKPTWLYVVGIVYPLMKDLLATRPFPGRVPTHWCSGNRNNKGGGSVPAGIRVCSAQQRRRTPLAFAEWLTEAASLARPLARSA